MAHAHERGSTLLDVLLASALGAILALISLGILRSGLALASHANTLAIDLQAADSLSNRMRAHARSSWSIFVPAVDLKNRDNRDGHEIDFYTRTANQIPIFWAECYDAASRRITSYSYGHRGDTPIPESTRIEHVTQFIATWAGLDDLNNPDSKTQDRLFTNATLHNARVVFPSEPGLYGGNGIVIVSFSIGSIHRSATYASLTAPTGFTVSVPYN